MDAGGRLFEETRATGIDGGSRPRVKNRAATPVPTVTPSAPAIPPIMTLPRSSDATRNTVTSTKCATTAPNATPAGFAKCLNCVRVRSASACGRSIIPPTCQNTVDAFPLSRKAITLYERPAGTRLDQLLTTLSVSENECQLARALCHRTFDVDLHRGRSDNTIVANSVYTALRQAGQPHSLDEIADASSVSRSDLGRTYKALVRELDLNIEPTDPHPFVSRFGDQLGMDQSTLSTAHNIVDAANKTDIRSGRSPTGTTAGALYLAGLLTGEHIIQREVAKATETSLVTLRDRYQEQATLIGIDRRVWSPPLVSTFDASPLSTEAINEQLDHLKIFDLTTDLVTSQARCTICDRTGEYGHLVRSHYTRRIVPVLSNTTVSTSFARSRTSPSLE